MRRELRLGTHIVGEHLRTTHQSEAVTAPARHIKPVAQTDALGVDEEAPEAHKNPAAQGPAGAVCPEYGQNWPAGHERQSATVEEPVCQRKKGQQIRHMMKQTTASIRELRTVLEYVPIGHSA